jgi:hypothetical protein
MTAYTVNSSPVAECGGALGRVRRHAREAIGGAVQNTSNNSQVGAVNRSAQHSRTTRSMD